MKSFVLHDRKPTGLPNVIVRINNFVLQNKKELMKRKVIATKEAIKSGDFYGKGAKAV